MAFGVVDLNNVMTGINEFTSIRHQEETKGMVQQGNIQQQLEKSVEVKLNNVRESDDANYNQKKFDAKEKGSNEYSGDGGQGKKKKDETDGRVIPKYSGFDMKI